MKGLTLNGSLLASSIVAGALFGAVLVSTPEASAAPGTPTCEWRSDAHIAEHGGRWADDEYHVRIGELPNCKPAVDSRSESEPKESENDRESRYCRKRWFC